MDTELRTKKEQLSEDSEVDEIFTQLSVDIHKAKAHIFREVNSTLVLLNWHIGNVINLNILQNTRAEYGKNTIDKLSQKLTCRFGKGYTKFALSRMTKIARLFPDKEIVATLSQELTWSHFIELCTIDDALKRDFYAEMARIERWSIRAMRNKIAGMLYERTAIAKKPIKEIESDIQLLHNSGQLKEDFIFQDPYLFDFIGVSVDSEKNLEDAIIKDIEKFLLEMGAEFSFIARQKRITVDGVDYRMDLLMYHRILKSMVVIELKLGKFMAADKGQIELYLRWLEKNEMQEGENKPIGLVLCSEKSESHIELLALDDSSIRVAQFLTELPPKELFEERLRLAIQKAREKFPKSS